MVRMAVLLVGLSLFGLTSQAQNRIYGTLQDKTDQKAVASATVSLLLQKDSSEVNKVISDSSGNFHFDNVLNDSFIVTVNTLNYQQYVSFITINSADKNMGNLQLERQGKDLSVVTVVAKATPVVQRGDTTQLSASQYKVNPDATTEDLIKKMPGITVAKDGTVTAQGEQVKKVTIDGKEFFGDDASAALKNLPSEVVDKIQIFDKLSDQAQLTGFDDGNSVKAINIVTKSGIKNGQFGRIYAGYGTDSRYSAGGNVSFFKGDRRLSLVGNFNNINQQNFGAQDLLGVTSSGNNRGGQGGGRGGQGGGGGRPGGGGTDNFTVGQASGISKTNALGLNFSNVYNKKLTLAGSYFFNNSKNDNESLVNTETFGVNKSQFSRQASTASSDNYNHRINARLEYRFDSSNTLFIIPSINLQKYSSISNALTQTYEGIADSTSNSNTYSTNDRTGYNIRNNIMFRHAFAKKGRSLSLGFNTSFNKNDGESIVDAKYRFYDTGTPYDSAQNKFYDNHTDGKTIGGTVAYTEPVGAKAQIQIDYNPSVQKNTTDQQTYSFDGQKYGIFDPFFSNNFENTITTNNAGLNYRYSPSRDEQLSFGVNFQHSNLKSDRTYPAPASVDQSFTNFLPNLMWRKKLGNASNIRVFYRASTNFPSVSQLQDVVNPPTNPLRLTSGNPSLQQSYTHFIAGRYSYTNSKTQRSFFANLFAQTANDFISNATYIAVNGDSTLQQNVVLKRGSQLSKPVNLDGYKNLRSFFTFSTPLKGIKTILNLNAGAGYSKLPGLVNNKLTNTDNFTYNAGLVLASNISEFVDFNLSYSANFNDTKTTGASNSTSNSVNQLAGLQLNLLNKQGWFVQNDISGQTYSGLSAGLNQSFWLWNAAIGKKFLKNRAGELKLSVFDLLKQNQSIVRTVTNAYIEDAQSKVLQQYFLLTFTYNLKNFGTVKAASPARERRMMDGGPGM